MLKLYKNTSTVTTSSNSPVLLSDLFRTRAVHILDTLVTTDTSNTALNWNDNFATAALACQSFKVLSGSSTPVDIDMQGLAYYNFVVSGMNPSLWANTGNGTQVWASTYDASLFWSKNPLDTEFNPKDVTKVQYGTYSAASDICSDAGFAVTSNTVDTYQVFDVMAGTMKNAHIGAIKRIQAIQQGLTATQNGQGILLTFQAGDRLSKLICLFGTGNRGAIKPAEVVTGNVTLDLGGEKIYDSIDYHVIKHNFRHYHSYYGGTLAGDIKPVNGSTNGAISGPTGLLVVTLPGRDQNQFGQSLPITNTSNNRLIVDTGSTSNPVAVIYAESIQGTPTSVLKDAQKSGSALPITPR